MLKLNELMLQLIDVINKVGFDKNPGLVIYDKDKKRMYPVETPTYYMNENFIMFTISKGVGLDDD